MYASPIVDHGFLVSLFLMSYALQRYILPWFAHHLDIIGVTNDLAYSVKDKKEFRLGGNGKMNFILVKVNRPHKENHSISAYNNTWQRLSYAQRCETDEHWAYSSRQV
jgi:hypothetical protein